MHLKRNSLYRTPEGRYYVYNGVTINLGLFGHKLQFFRISNQGRMRGGVLLNVHELHSPGVWLRSLQLVGNNYAHRIP